MHPNKCSPNQISEITSLYKFLKKRNQKQLQGKKRWNLIADKSEGAKSNRANKVFHSSNMHAFSTFVKLKQRVTKSQKPYTPPQSQEE